MRISENRLDEILKYWRAEPDQDVELAPTPHDNAFLALDLRDARKELSELSRLVSDHEASFHTPQPNPQHARSLLKIAKTALQNIIDTHDCDGSCSLKRDIAEKALEQLK